MISITADLKGRRAIVTGGANGIGRAIVAAYARQGMRVLFNYRRQDDDAQSLCEQLRAAGADVESVLCDLGEPGAVDKLLDTALHRLGGIDVLVNNVATLTRSSFLEITAEDYDRVLGVNLRVPFFLTQRVAARMVLEGVHGSIVNVSSLSSRRCRSSVAHYQISKAGLEALTRSAAYELGRHSIRVNAICPGLTATAANREQWESQPTLWSQRSVGIPLGRTGTADDHASAAVYFASQASAWVTGASLVIDGGMSTY